MDYQYENLGPEKFQQLCQAITSKEFPNVQCFPVAQRDGGRDIVSFELGKPKSNEFVVFQVKYVRNPFGDTDPHKWLIGILKDEIPKVKHLIERGAKSFYLLTNVPGTAHLDSGSIDKMHTLLNKETGIPSMCWWRDDLNRRLDLLPELKWIYTELMTGSDLLQEIVEKGLSEHKNRRIAAVKAFLRDQYDIDKEVRFKQVELQNRLLDLFVDVPILFENNQYSRKRQHLFYSIARNLSRSLNDVAVEDLFTDVEVDLDNIGREEALYRQRDPSIGAATLLLNPLGQKHIPRMVLEGAPGQGKSTITQYICQVHRMRILEKLHDLQSLPNNHKNSPVRLPFKIDLRDLSTWLSKKNPFSADETDTPPINWRKSLEAFLAAQVTHHSGGASFDYDDLIAVAKLSSILLVFDGLDEVADISRRQEVVDEIVKGVNRLEENAASIQVIVTSRPAAFANSPGLPSENFPYYQLASLTRPLIDEYAGRWIKARRLDGREGGEVRKILRTKLDQPHLRDLARNPMQLAILLSLIHTRGSSLPDKRTALYQSYVELFFSRESEKSDIVREHRDLLVDIHGYLAWILHSEAEQGQERGSITTDRLQHLLSSYLDVEGHDVNLSKTLFAGMVERVVALVSRVEGTFEFEVQPLREYFAARYLYVTAPYSPVGDEKRGTKPDRFDAIAKNFYWLNVTRFYAGCFDKGELPALVDRLQELIEDNDFKNTSHPRVLAATLLSDWVFSQHPKSVKAVISLVLDDVGLRYILSSSSRRFGQGSALILPPKCGNEELIQYAFSILQSNPPWDFASDLIDLITANSSSERTTAIWLRYATDETDNRDRWFRYGINLGALARISIEEINTLMKDSPASSNRLVTLFRSKRTDYCTSSTILFDTTVKIILQGRLKNSRTKRSETILELLSYVVDTSRYKVAFGVRHLMTLNDLWEHHVPQFGKLTPERIKELPNYEVATNVLKIINVAVQEADRSCEEWATQIAPWNNIVEQVRSIWGETWASCEIANVAAGIKSSKETCTDASALFDKSKALCRRARYARLRSGSNQWWRKQAEEIDGPHDRMLFILLFVTWTTSTTFQNSINVLDQVLKLLSKQEWEQVISTVKQDVPTSDDSADAQLLSFDLSIFPDTLSPRTATIVALRSKQHLTKQLYTKYLAAYDGDDRIILEFCQKEALDLSNLSEAHWSPNLDLVSRSYLKGAAYNPYTFQQMTRLVKINDFPLSVAKDIIVNANRYPGHLVAFAEAKCRQVVAEQIVPVGIVAEKNDWFI